MLPSEKLTEHAEKIRALGRRAQQDILEIGRLLTEAKALCAHGEWLPWLQKEFAWSEATACRFMRIHAFASEFKSGTLPDLSLSLSTLDELSRRRTPPEVVTQIIAKAERGERVTASEVKEASAAAVPSPERGPTRALWPPLPPLEVTHHKIPLAAVAYVRRDYPPAIDWTLLLWLKNIASLINSVAGVSGLDDAIGKLISAGHGDDVARAAEAFARAGGFAERLTALIEAAKAESSSEKKDCAP